MFVFDLQMIYLGGGLIGLILVNILLGSLGSILERNFDREKLLQGFLKGIIVTLAFIACYAIGSLNPNIIVINANGQDLDLLTAIYAITLAGYVWYGKEVVIKLATIVGGKFEVK